MKQIFFITGLPRSRTAWLANFFTTQTAFCRHDALKDGWTAEFLRDRLNVPMDGITHAGDADTALTLHAEELASFFPDARWLFVRNTVERSTASYRKAFPPERPYPGCAPGGNVEQMLAQCQAYYADAFLKVPSANRLELDVCDLAFPQVMHTAWDWLVPGLKWDAERHAMLETFRVQIIAEKIAVAKVPEDWKRETLYATK